MARRKVKLAFIANDSARKASFRKRKNGLLKKMNELSTLCDVTVCAIIYGPGDTQPEIWPPSVTDLNDVLDKFREMPEMNQRKKMVDQERFLMQRIVKARDQVKKHVRDNRDKEVALAMYGNLSGAFGLQGMNASDLEDLGRVIDQTLTEIHDTEQRLITSSHVDPSISMQVQPWFIDLKKNAPPPPIPQPSQQPRPQPLELVDYFNGDCSGGYIGGDQNLMMIPFGHNFNLWPNSSISNNLFYP